MAKTKTNSKPRRASRPSTKPASRKPKTSTRKAASSSKAKSPAPNSAVVTIDRRRTLRRQGEDLAATPQAPPVPARLERRQKVNRRRQIDPTTCERDYTDDEVQFMNALDDYKRASGRMFPTCSEVLEVVRSLGYVRLSPNESANSTSPFSAVAPAANSATQEFAAERDWR